MAVRHNVVIAWALVMTVGHNVVKAGALVMRCTARRTVSHVGFLPNV